MTKQTKREQEIVLYANEAYKHPFLNSSISLYFCADLYQASHLGNGLPASGVSFTLLLETKHD